MTEAFPLIVVNDHLIIWVGDKLAIIDTGSPFSIGRGEPLDIAGRTWNALSSQSSILDAAGEHIGKAIEWLVGTDILATMPILIDWPGGQVVFDHDISHLVPNESIPLRMTLGVPALEVTYDAGGACAILDSGAPISYGPTLAFGARPSLGIRADFYPGAGSFPTEVFQVPVGVNGRAVAVTAGVLPSMLGLSLGLIVGPNGWILGIDFFRGRAIVLDLGQGRMWDVGP
jgi:hypothetical protein